MFLAARSYEFLFNNLGHFLRAAAIPAIGYWVGLVAVEFAPNSYIARGVWEFSSMVFLSIFAVSWYRLFLLGQDKARPALVPQLGKRELRFIACVILLELVLWSLAWSMELMDSSYYSDEAETGPIETGLIMSMEVHGYVILTLIVMTCFVLWPSRVFSMIGLSWFFHGITTSRYWAFWRRHKSNGIRRCIACVVIASPVVIILREFDLSRTDVEEGIHIFSLITFFYVWFVLGCWIFLRFGLVFPAIALDVSRSWKLHLINSWADMRGHALSLAGAAAVILLPSIFFSIAMDDLAFFLADVDGFGLIAYGFMIISVFSVEAMFVTQLSLAFLLLSGWSPAQESN